MSEETNFKPRAPDYSGSGVSIWKHVDKNNKPYLKVVILGSLKVNCFKVEQQPKPAEDL